MAYLFAYRLQWENVEGITKRVDFYDTQSGEGTTVFTELEGADDVAHVFVVDNDESKFSPIRAKQMEIKFYSTDTENLTSFIDSSDNRWKVEYYVNDNLKFTGFLVLDDLDEDFLDSDASNVVTLIATDNIGLLKDEPLTNFDGENPRGEFNLITYVAWALSKTGLSLPINVVHNVKEENDSAKIMYESCYLHSKTFEKEIGESEDCYSVLEKILKHDSFLTQANGEWWLIRIDELQDDASINNKFTSLGVASGTTAFNITQIIEPPDMDIEVMNFTDRETFVKFQAAVKRARLTYNYSYPKEIIDNIDFERGDLAIPVSIPPYVAYEIDDWALLKNFAGDAADTSAYILRKFEDGYEKERFAVIVHSVGGGYYYLRSNKIPIEEKDKFVFSVDARYSADLSGTGSYTHFLAQIRLYGSDGSHWILDSRSNVGGTPIWKLSNSTWSINNGYVYQQGNLADDLTEWYTGTVEAPPVPISGDIEIQLLHTAVSNSVDRYFQNLQFTYQPYINGSYQKYFGQYNQVSQDINTKKVYEEEVYISDSPRQLFKGALLRYNGTKYVLAGRFYDGRQFTSGVPADEFLHPFGFNQIYCVWNQNNRTFRVIDFKLQGMNGTGVFPDIIHKWTVNETHAHSTNKIFQLLHFDMDMHLCETKGVMAEVFDTTIPKDYDSELEFKYVSER